jgi:hypothetical protein
LPISNQIRTWKNFAAFISPQSGILFFCGAGIIMLSLKQWMAKGQTSNKMSESI